MFAIVALHRTTASGIVVFAHQPVVKGGQIDWTVSTKTGYIMGDRLAPAFGQMQVPASAVYLSAVLTPSMITNHSFGNTQQTGNLPVDDTLAA
jgi:hypothetical protein